MTLNKFQLELLPSDDLRQLVSDASKVLNDRARIDRINRNTQRRLALRDARYAQYPDLNEYNRSALLAIPDSCRGKPAGHLYFLPPLLDQDWSSIYPESGGPAAFYVYAHVDPTKPHFIAQNKYGGSFNGRPFYIGKGTGGRAYDLKRNQGHGRILKRLKDEQVVPESIVKIIFDGLTESKALEYESKLIYYFGTMYDPAHTDARRLWLVNLDVPKTPEFTGFMKTKTQWKQEHKELLEPEMEAA